MFLYSGVIKFKRVLFVSSFGIYLPCSTLEGALNFLNCIINISSIKCRVYVSDEDITHWKENAVSPSLRIDSMRDVVRIFINGKLIGKRQFFQIVYLNLFELCLSQTGQIKKLDKGNRSNVLKDAQSCHYAYNLLNCIIQRS